MHDIEIVVIWFLSVNAGMLLTLLMPRIVSEPCGCEVIQVEFEQIPAPQGVHKQEGLMVLSGVRPMGKSRVTRERGATSPIQAA